MDHNIYAPPAARLEVENEASQVHAFYVVSPAKFFLLFLISSGLYSVYWFYKNWALQKQAFNEDLWPVPRGIFAIFFTHALFRRVDITLKEQNGDFPWNPGAVATGFVLLSIFYNLSDNFYDYTESTLNMTVVWIALDFVVLGLLAYVLFQAQKAINHAVGDPKGESNDQLSLANWAWIALFALSWVFAFFVLAIVVFPTLMP